MIDIHVHTTRHTRVFPRPGARPGYERYASPEELIAGYDSIGVQSACLLPELNPECCTDFQSVDEILRICEDFPGRFLPFCNIDPRQLSNSPWSPLGDMMKYYRDLGCLGVGEICANLPILHPLVQNLFRGAEEAGLPLTFHLSPYVGHDYGLVDDAGLPQLEVSLQRFPKLVFLAHSQTFWAEMGANPTIGERMSYPMGEIQEEGRVAKLMRKYPTLMGDLSAGSGCNALTRDRKYAVAFLNEFQDRLLWGTDICQPAMPTLKPLMEFLKNLRITGEISEEVFDKVTTKNAERILKLG